MTKAHEQITATDAGKVTEGASVADLMAAYLSDLDASDRTRHSYDRAIRRYISWLDGEGVRLEQTTRAHVLGYKRHLQATKSAATVNAYLVAVRSLYAWLNVRTGYPDVARDVKGARKGRSERAALTVAQARDLLAAPADGERGLRDRAMISLMLRRGLRTIEVSRADVGDLRPVNGVMCLRVRGKGRDGKDDLIVLGDACERAIRDYLKARGGAEPAEPLFTATGNRNGGGRMTTRSISRVAKQTMSACGIESPHLTAHSLRHTAVTLALLGGATVQEAQAMARHASIDTTMLYAHNLDRLEARAEHAIDDILAGSEDGGAR